MDIVITNLNITFCRTVILVGKLSAITFWWIRQPKRKFRTAISYMPGSHAIFCMEPFRRTDDFYERALYNHILLTKLKQEWFAIVFIIATPKNYCNAETTFGAVGTGFENHVKYAEQIYSHNENELYINLIHSFRIGLEKNEMKTNKQFSDTEQIQPITYRNSTRHHFSCTLSNWQCKSGYIK